ncbi:Cell division protein FtsL [invertebrate metagenome]|uniref:Cell division protein FtsL n=1 Tax=invertebrate metagenome TaxID=1711999 RepID=A0A2H9TAR8_9ZZZZ
MIKKPISMLFDRKNQMVGILLLLIVISGASVSFTAYKNRQLHNQLKTVQDQRNRAQVEWGRLLLEYSTLTTPARIEKLAMERLNMEMPAAGQIITVN